MDLIGNSNGAIDGSFTDFEALLSDTTLFDLFPEKLEGLAFGPTLANGDLLLLLNNDNDFRDDQFNYIFAFAVDQADLDYAWSVVEPHFRI